MALSLNRPDVNGGRHEKKEKKVRQYLMDWYEETPEEFEVNWSKVTIIVSGRLKSSNGMARLINEDEMELKIALKVLENHSWESAKNTIRHEAIHIYDYQENGYGGGHGRVFKKWADRFGCSQYADKPAERPKYEIICPNCGVVDSKHRKCKTVKKIERYHCGNCESQELSVRKNK